MHVKKCDNLNVTICPTISIGMVDAKSLLKGRCMTNDFITELITTDNFNSIEEGQDIYEFPADVEANPSSLENSKQYRVVGIKGKFKNLSTGQPQWDDMSTIELDRILTNEEEAEKRLLSKDELLNGRWHIWK